MKNFSFLFRELEGGHTNRNKVIALAKYFDAVSDADKMWAIALFTNKRPSRSLEISCLRKWALEVSGVPEWLFEESENSVGNQVETIALILGASNKGSHLENESLSFVMEKINGLKAEGDEAKKAFVIQAWARFDFYGRYILNLLLTGRFRMSISQKIILDAIEMMTGKKAISLAHRVIGKWTPVKNTFQDLILDNNPVDQLSLPYPFWGTKECVEDDLEKMVSSLVVQNKLQIERTWGGLRSQIICRGGQIFIWSEGEELMNDQFPEFQQLKAILPEGTVLEGEIVVWIFDRPSGFNGLQKRTNLRKPNKKIMQEFPVLFITFDFLEKESRDISMKELSTRRRLLKELFEQLENQSEILLLSDCLTLNTWEDLKAEWKLSREKHSRGLLIRNQSSTFIQKNTEKPWWKWNCAPMRMEMVLIYIQADRRSSNRLNPEVTFAVRDSKQYLPVAKTDLSLNQEESLEIVNWAKANTKEKFGPVRSVHLELVFMISFEGIALSNRNKSGVILQAPKIESWQKDCNLSDVQTISALKGLLEI